MLHSKGKLTSRRKLNLNEKYVRQSSRKDRKFKDEFSLLYPRFLGELETGSSRGSSIVVRCGVGMVLSRGMNLIRDKEFVRRKYFLVSFPSTISDGKIEDWISCSWFEIAYQN